MDVDVDVTISPITTDFRLERPERDPLGSPEESSKGPPKRSNVLHIISNRDRNLRELLVDLYIPIALEIHEGYVIKWEIAPKFKKLLRHMLQDMDSFGPPIINGIHFGLSLILGVPITEHILTNDVVIIGTIMKDEEYNSSEPDVNFSVELF